MQVSNWCIGLIAVLSLSAMTSYAQLEVRSIDRVERSPVSSQARVLAVRDTINLPFWDDFSMSSYTDSSRWLDNTGAWVNGTLGKSSPTLNVVSFDGVDLYGNPHNPDGVNSETGDVLTSQPINLAVIPVEKRDSLWFSFYWQMGGWGEVPEQRDSLSIEFLDKDGEWVFAMPPKTGKDTLLDKFIKESIHIHQDEYFHSGFQFRFRASGNSLGPYDAWHIDYVYLNIDRHAANESIWDHGIASVPTSIFSEYSMIPYDVIFDFPDTLYKDIEVEMSNFIDQVHFPNFIVTVRDTLMDNILYSQPITGGGRLNGLGRVTLIADSVPKQNLQAAPTDSLYLEFEMIIGSGDEYFVSEINGSNNEDTVYLINDFYNYKLNDTVRSYHEIHHTLAYDDGSAEYAAGLNKNKSQLAIAYNIPSKDTLTSVDLYFPQFSRPPADAISPSGKRFVLYVMSDSLGFPGPVLRTQEFVIPGGATLNQFDRFTFDVPVILSGKFHISFQQLVNEYIGIGLDNNTLIGTQKLTVKTDENLGWENNVKVEGMVMIRAIFEDSEFVVTSVDKLGDQLKIFPNPASNRITIQGDFDQYQLLNLSGRLIKVGQTNDLMVSDIENGIYFLRIRSGQSIITQKVIVRH